MDAYKSKIDDCGISGELFEDPDFGFPETMQEQLASFKLSEEE
jgi:hypothetical protein